MSPKNVQKEVDEALKALDKTKKEIKDVKKAVKTKKSSKTSKSKKRSSRKRRNTVPPASIKRRFKERGVERMSNDATKEVLKRIDKMADDAAKLAKHAGRKTVKPEDIVQTDGLK